MSPTALADWATSDWDGEKFPGGLGPVEVLLEDYWAIRARSEALFTRNPYAQGLVGRLVTNEISTGLTPEAAPEEAVLGVPEDSLEDWTELTETRFSLYSNTPALCDFKGALTLGQLMAQIRQEAYISGDVLVVLRYTGELLLPAVQVVKGSAVRTPLDAVRIPQGHTITEGIQRDSDGREVAYWVRQTDGTFKKQPAYGPRTGRRLAWMVTGLRKRPDRPRGEPLLAVFLQSLKDLDRYKDSTTRKAVINSYLAMVVTSEQDKASTLPLQGATRHGATTQKEQKAQESTGFSFSKLLPGLLVQRLPAGQKVELKGGEGTDLNFQPFEAGILHAVAWVRECPPEILLLQFSNNYSASQAAINEFKIYINRIWAEFGAEFCDRLRMEWMISEALNGDLGAPGFLQDWRKKDLMRLAAWAYCDWYGAIKPSTDLVKQTRGAQALIAEGWTTNAKVSRELTGTKYSRNLKRLRKENEEKAKALEPLLLLKQQQGNSGNTAQTVAERLDDFEEILADVATK